MELSLLTRHMVNGYILTADMEFEKYYGAPATKRRKLYNGALRTDLYQYWGKKDRSKIKTLK